jgi:tRNA A-37 threonylcarbamoyl transferase component Bud32
LYIDLKGRTIFQEFIQGKNLGEIIKRSVSTGQTDEEEASMMRDAGRRVAQVHKLGVAIGDCKPENIIIADNGKTYFIDLEQASKDENQAWDIAEFLYYTGHYTTLFSNNKAIEFLAKEFILGYIEAGGDKKNVREAGSGRYTKVFRVFTLPSVISTLSNLCKENGKRDA